MGKKRVLFLGVGLYNYDSTILEVLSKVYDVNYVYLLPIKKQKKYIYSILSHIDKKEKIQAINSHLLLENLRKSLTNEYDFVLVVKGSRLEQCHFDLIQSKTPRAKKILYLWDAWGLIENKNVLLKNFDFIYSFDSVDCRKYGFILRPLFFTQKDSSKTNKIIDVSFIGTEHSNRLSQLRLLKKICITNNLKYYFRLKTTFVPIFEAHFGLGGYKKDDLDILSTSVSSYHEVLCVTARSKCIVDYAHPMQCGLTMRTLESLAMGCKLITSNKYISEYEDIDRSWYLCIDSNTSEKEVLDFINSESVQIKIPERYSIVSFIKDLLGDQ